MLVLSKISYILQVLSSLAGHLSPMSAWTPHITILFWIQHCSLYCTLQCKLYWTLYCTLHCTVHCTVLYNKLFPCVQVAGWELTYSLRNTALHASFILYLTLCYILYWKLAAHCTLQYIEHCTVNCTLHFTLLYTLQKCQCGWLTRNTFIPVSSALLLNKLLYNVLYTLL